MVVLTYYERRIWFDALNDDASGHELSERVNESDPDISSNVSRSCR